MRGLMSPPAVNAPVVVRGWWGGGVVVVVMMMMMMMMMILMTIVTRLSLPKHCTLTPPTFSNHAAAASPMYSPPLARPLMSRDL